MIDRDVPTTGLERLLAHLLLAGAVMSAGCLATGLLFWLIDHGSPAGRLLLNVGLVVLMLAPVQRILIAIVESLRLRDRVFVASTFIVAAVLSVTLLLTLDK